MLKTNLFRHASDAVAFPKGQALFSEGETGKQMFVIIEGEVDIIHDGVLLESAGPGSMVGEMALIDDAPRSATVVAKTDCRAVPVDEQKFKYLVQQTPMFAIQVMQVLANRLRKTTNQITARAKANA